MSLKSVNEELRKEIESFQKRESDIASSECSLNIKLAEIKDQQSKIDIERKAIDELHEGIKEEEKAIQEDKIALDNEWGDINNKKNALKKREAELVKKEAELANKYNSSKSELYSEEARSVMEKIKVENTMLKDKIACNKSMMEEILSKNNLLRQQQNALKDEYCRAQENLAIKVKEFESAKQEINLRDIKLSSLNEELLMLKCNPIETAAVNPFKQSVNSKKLKARDVAGATELHPEKTLKRDNSTLGIKCETKMKRIKLMKDSEYHDPYVAASPSIADKLEVVGNEIHPPIIEADLDVPSDSEIGICDTRDSTTVLSGNNSTGDVENMMDDFISDMKQKRQKNEELNQSYPPKHIVFNNEKAQNYRIDDGVEVKVGTSSSPASHVKPAISVRNISSLQLSIGPSDDVVIPNLAQCSSSVEISDDLLRERDLAAQRDKLIEDNMKSEVANIVKKCLQRFYLKGGASIQSEEEFDGLTNKFTELFKDDIIAAHRLHSMNLDNLTLSSEDKRSFIDQIVFYFEVKNTVYTRLEATKMYPAKAQLIGEVDKFTDSLNTQLRDSYKALKNSLVDIQLTTDFKERIRQLITRETSC